MDNRNVTIRHVAAVMISLAVSAYSMALGLGALPEKARVAFCGHRRGRCRCGWCCPAIQSGLRRLLPRSPDQGKAAPVCQSDDSGIYADLVMTTPAHGCRPRIIAATAWPHLTVAARSRRASGANGCAFAAARRTRSLRGGCNAPASYASFARPSFTRPSFTRWSGRAGPPSLPRKTSWY